MRHSVTRCLKQWARDWYGIFAGELKRIFTDSGVLIIFLLAGLGYPLLYGIVYHNGTLDDMPVAVVDNSGSSASREFTRALDATRELSVVRSCADMAEARQCMQKRQVHGIVMIPADFDSRLARMEQAAVSTYADMSSFLYYKNMTMGVNNVMLGKMSEIQAGRLAVAGHAGEEIRMMCSPLRYTSEIPYNRNFSYTIFFLSAVLLIVVQQTMFYGVSMLSGTMREEGRCLSGMPGERTGRGISRTVLGRGAAYWVLYMGIGIYIASIVPAIAGLPQNTGFGNIMVLLLFYVTACTFFSLAFSTIVRHRETVFVLFLFMSPVCLFLTGFAWPASNFPGFWRLFSYIFPSTFAVRAFIDMNTAGADIAMAGQHMTALGIQIIVYYLLSCLSAYDENLSGRAFWRALCHKKPRLNSRHYETTDFDAGSDISRVHRVSPEERNPTGTYRQVEERYGRLPGQEGTGA